MARRFSDDEDDLPSQGPGSPEFRSKLIRTGDLHTVSPRVRLQEQKQAPHPSINKRQGK